MKRLLLMITILATVVSCGSDKTNKSNSTKTGPNGNAAATACQPNEVCSVQLISTADPLEFSFAAGNNVTGSFTVQACASDRVSCVPTSISINCNAGSCYDINANITSPLTNNGRVHYHAQNTSIGNFQTIRVFRL